MTFAEYQTAARRTSVWQNAPRDEASQQGNITNAILGLCGESGELADYIKKVLYQGHTLSYDKLIEELGDVLWYIAELCTAYDLRLDDVVEANIAKLEKRYGTAFSTARSIQRDATSANATAWPAR